MSQQFDNTNRGILFRNDRKTHASQPDYKGQINVNGQELWISSWIKEGQNGKFMSLSVTPKEDQPNQLAKPQAKQPARQQQRQQDDIQDSEIPF